MSEADCGFPNLNFQAWVEQDCRPRLIVTVDRQIVWRNNAAEKLLRKPRPLYLQGRHLCLALRQAAEAFDRRLACVGVEPERVPIGGKDSRMEMIVRVQASDHDGHRLLYLTAGMTKTPPAVHDNGMVEFYGLTRAEALVLEALCQLDQPAAIAERLSVSVHTVRTHLRSIYNKTSVHSHIQLQRLALVFDGA